MKKGKDIWSLGNINKNYLAFRPKIPEHFYDKIIELLKSKHNYLDIACGPGNTIFKMHKHFDGHKIGIDSSPGQIDSFKKHILEKNLQDQNIEPVLGDPRNIFSIIGDQKIQEKGFDLVTCSQGLHYFKYSEICDFISDKLLSEKGMFAVIGYYARGFDFLEDNTRTVGNQIFSSFYEPIKKDFIFDREELNDAYKSQNLQRHFKLTLYEEETEVLSIQKLEQYIGYLNTFSGLQLYVEKHKGDADFVHPLENMQNLIKNYENSLNKKCDEILTRFMFFIKIFANNK